MLYCHNRRAVKSLISIYRLKMSFKCFRKVTRTLLTFLKVRKYFLFIFGTFIFTLEVDRYEKLKSCLAIGNLNGILTRFGLVTVHYLRKLLWFVIMIRSCILFINKVSFLCFVLVVIYYILGALVVQFSTREKYNFIIASLWHQMKTNSLWCCFW